MRKNKFIYTLSALMMACIISFSGVGGSYIQAEASSGVFDVLWNTDVDAWTNIKKHIELWCCTIGVYPNFSLALLNAEDFKEFMLSDGYSEEEAEECVHGGGGHVRDGISVDDDGNVTYSDEVSDLFHDYICNYLGLDDFWVVETMAADEIPSWWFNDNITWQNTVQTVKNLGLVFMQVSSYYETTGLHNIWFAPFDTGNFVLSISSDVFSEDTAIKHVSMDEDYNVLTYSARRLIVKDTDSSYCQDIIVNRSLVLDDFSGIEDVGPTIWTYRLLSYVYDSGNQIYFYGLCSPDGRLVKVFKSEDAFKKYMLREKQYYSTSGFYLYDASQDNSITMTSTEYQYYSDNSTTIYQTIQNNIDNSGSDLTEEDIQKIVDDAVKEIKDSIQNDSGNDDSGDGSVSDNDSGNGGTGVSDLIEGIGKIFDTILSLIGKLMGVVADFTQSILDLFSGFTTFTDGFSDFLAGAFSFIPVEVWDIIKVGLSLMVLLAVIKFLRK